MLKMLACLDSDEMAVSRRQKLDVPRSVAAALGRSAVEAATNGYYIYGVLCRSSALYHTIFDDEMYTEHRQRSRPDSTDWAIYSPGVPVFRADDGTELEHPWTLSFLTCGAPYAPAIGQPEAGDLLRRRINRVLAIARAYEHSTLVLGAWGCGAFGNDVHRTAMDFRTVLENDFSGAFTDVIFAITDWSPERKFLGPFREAFAPDDK